MQRRQDEALLAMRKRPAACTTNIASPFRNAKMRSVHAEPTILQASRAAMFKTNATRSSRRTRTGLQLAGQQQRRRATKPLRSQGTTSCERRERREAASEQYVGAGWGAGVGRVRTRGRGGGRRANERCSTYSAEGSRGDRTGAESNGQLIHGAAAQANSPRQTPEFEERRLGDRSKFAASLQREAARSSSCV